MSRWGVIAAGVLWGSMADAVQLPRDAPAAHLGVQVCANSTCHGAGEASPFAAVAQDEHKIWSTQDAHSRAYRALESERGQQIARRLGLGNPTGEATCLACHSDYVTGSRKGKRHQYSDGVGCEACHGGAAKWLGFHASGVNTHAENVALGMYPTDDPKARAELCFSCHQGTTEHPMTHRLLGAGHPPLLIELDAYTIARPAHHVEDADYKRRKTVVDPLKVWAIGQVMAARQWMVLHETAHARSNGAWPEFSQYECYGCHRSTRGSNGSGVGLPQLNVGQLVTAAAALELVDAEAAGQLRSAAQALRAGQAGATGRVNDILKQALVSVSVASLPASRSPDLLRVLKARGRAGDFGTHAAGLQATYAAAIALDLLGRSDSPALGQLYAAVDDGSRYDAAAWLQAIEAVDVQ